MPRPILVTGSHRSGTSWVGRIIAASPSPRFHYLWEPFSILARPGVCAAGFPFWFPYVCPENEDACLAAVSDTVALRYNIEAELKAIRSPRDAARMAREWAAMTRARRAGARALLKDPIALFSAGWIAETYDADVVMIARHPAAFAGSIVGRSWRHPFEHFLRQPLLMHDRLGPFEPEIRRFAQQEQPLLDQAILLWNILHAEILRYRTSRPGWVFRRHEDLSVDPPNAFEDLYGDLGLVVDDRFREVVEHWSGPSNPSNTVVAGDMRRDSRAALGSWKRRFTEHEIGRIRDAVEPISGAFYGDEDW